MATKYKVKTTAVIDRNPVGSTIELPKETAESLFQKGYVDIIEEVKPKPKAKPKKAPTKKAEAKSKESDAKKE